MYYAHCCVEAISNEKILQLVYYIPGLIRPAERIKCLARGHNVVPLVRLEQATPR